MKHDLEALKEGFFNKFNNNILGKRALITNSIKLFLAKKKGFVFMFNIFINFYKKNICLKYLVFIPLFS